MKQRSVTAILGERLADKSPRAALTGLREHSARPIKTSIQGLTHIFPGPGDLAEAESREAAV